MKDVLLSLIDINNRLKYDIELLLINDNILIIYKNIPIYIIKDYVKIIYKNSTVYVLIKDIVQITQKE